MSEPYFNLLPTPLQGRKSDTHPITTINLNQISERCQIISVSALGKTPLKLVICTLNMSYMLHLHPLCICTLMEQEQHHSTVQVPSRNEATKRDAAEMPQHRYHTVSYVKLHFPLWEQQLIFSVALDSFLQECLPFLFSFLIISVKDNRDYKEAFLYYHF